MAVFNFKLKTIHRLKTQLEDLAKNRFGLAMAALNEELRKLNLIKDTIAATVEEFRTLSGGRFKAGKIKDYNSFLSLMKEREEIQAEAVERATKIVDREREALIQAAREREMFDKLKERAFTRHMFEERQAENRATDELVSYRGNSQSL